VSEQQEKQQVESKAIPLNVMLESTEEHIVRGTKYLIRPLFLGEVPEFQRDGLSVGSQFFNLADEEKSKMLDKWLQRIVFSKDGEPLSLQQLKDKHWNIKELKDILLKVIDISD